MTRLKIDLGTSGQDSSTSLATARTYPQRGPRWTVAGTLGFVALGLTCFALGLVLLAGATHPQALFPQESGSLVGLDSFIGQNPAVNCNNHTSTTRCTGVVGAFCSQCSEQPALLAFGVGSGWSVIGQADCGNKQTGTCNADNDCVGPYGTLGACNGFQTVIQQVN